MTIQRMEQAPGGLGLVQDLVNTNLVDEPQLAPDLLASLDGAQAWLRVPPLRPGRRRVCTH